MKNSKFNTPPLKWVGGKQRVLPFLLPHIAGTDRLIEPFVGAGSVFMSAGDRQVIINDANTDLMNFYRCLKDDVHNYIGMTEGLFTEENRNAEAYATHRLKFNASNSSSERAVLLLYLNKFGFNRLYRVNKNGGFNVPYGHPNNVPTFPKKLAGNGIKATKR